MKTFFLVVSALFSFTLTIAQERKDTVYRFGNDSMICSLSDTRTTDIVFTKVQQPPMFPGGEASWEKYVANNFKRLKNYKGIIEVWFIVDLDGTTSRFQIIRPSGLPLNEQESILNFFKATDKWYPARQKGYCVRAWNRVEINN